MQQQKQKKRVEDDGDKELQRNFEVQDDLAAEGEDEGVGGDYSKLEQQHQPPEKSLFRSNRNPMSSTRRISHGHCRPTETSNCRWVQVSQPNLPTVLPLNQPKLPPPVQARQPKPPPVVQIVEMKAQPVIHVSQSKPPPLVSPKVESDVEPCGEIHNSGKMEVKKKPRRNNKRKVEKKDVVQLQTEKCVKENPEQGFEVGRGNKDDEDARAEIEGKLAGLSLSSGTGESNGGKSMAVRNQRGFKEKKGGYGKFEGRAMLKERTKRESGLIWVKKGEAS